MKCARSATSLLVALLMAGASAGPAFAVEDATDNDFLKSAHQGQLAEIAAGNDALRNATTECVRQVGDVLVRDHTRLDEQIKALAEKLDVVLPGEPNAEQQAALAEVQAQAGSEAYDTAWLKSQDDAHRKTLELIDGQLESGQNAEITELARAARPVVATHLDMVSGGVCEEPAAAGEIPAGSGGHTATAEQRWAAPGAVALIGGMLLTAVSGGAWIARKRRTATR